MGQSTTISADWRDGRVYARLEGAGWSAWAWEWLRRDPGYRAEAVEWLSPPARGQSPVAAASRWGLLFYEDPDRDFMAARPFWIDGPCRRVLRAETAALEPAERFDAARLGDLLTIHAEQGIEHCLASNGFHSLRFDIRGGSIRQGPVGLRYQVEGVGSALRTLPLVGQLVAICRTGSFPHRIFAPVPRAGRHVLALRAFDAMAMGASHRKVAIELVDRDCGAPRWRDEMPSARTRSQRLAKLARAMASGGWRSFLC